MWTSKDIYYISDSTGIMITNLGQALVCQFPEINFNEEQFPYIRTKEEAEKTLSYILEKSRGRRPIIFSTIMDNKVRDIFRASEVEFFDAFDFFLEPLEECLEAKALRVPGFSRHFDDVHMARRVEAIHYTLDHDDGTRTEELNEAEVILVGVSRSGKTPVSVYMATHMGLKVANFPLTNEYLHKSHIHTDVRRNLKKAIGLTTTPELLKNMREKRYPGSDYASISTCRAELSLAEIIFKQNNIPIISTAGKSIEEMATQVSQEMGLARKIMRP